MKSVNMHEAKTHLSRLVQEAARGESFVIAKAGKPMVKVVPLDAPEGRKSPRLGMLKGQIKVPDDFDTMYQDDIIAMFERSYDGDSESSDDAVREREA